MITKEQIKALPTFPWDRAAYDAHQALNQSGSKEILRSPGHYKAYLDGAKKETPALRIGSLTHLFCLQPDLFASQVITLPDDAPKKPTEKQRTAKKPTPATLEAIAWWDNFDQVSQGKTVADRDELEEAMRAGKALNDELKHWGITPLATELCLATTYDGIKMKSQLDMITTDGWIIDLKTFGDYITPRNVLATTYKRGYHLQAAFYCLMYKQTFGVRPQGFKMICAEKAAPNATGCFELSSQLIAEGGVLLAQAIEAYKACTAFDSYPTYPKQIHTLQPYPTKGEADAITFA